MSEKRTTHPGTTYRQMRIWSLPFILIALMGFGAQDASATKVCHSKNIKVIKSNNQVIVYKHKVQRSIFVCNRTSKSRFNLGMSKQGSYLGVVSGVHDIQVQGGYVLYFNYYADAGCRGHCDPGEDTADLFDDLIVLNSRTGKDDIIWDFTSFDESTHKIFFSKNRRLAWAVKESSKEIRIYSTEKVISKYGTYNSTVEVDAGPIPIKSIKLTKSGVLKWKKNGESKSQALDPYDFVSG